MRHLARPLLSERPAHWLIAIAMRSSVSLLRHASHHTSMIERMKSAHSPDGILDVFLGK